MGSFISFCSLRAMTETSKTMLNSSGESRHSCLFLTLGDMAFHFSPLRIMFDVGLSNMAFISLRYFHSMPDFRFFFFFTNRC